MPSFRVSVSVPVFDKDKFIKDVKIAVDKAVIEAARQVYKLMLKQVKFYTGFSQGAVSNIGEASVGGLTVGNMNAAGRFDPRLKSSAAIRALIPGAKRNQFYTAKKRIDNHKSKRVHRYEGIEKTFESGKGFGTDPASIIKATIDGTVNFAFRANIDYWMQGKNASWGTLTQYKELFVEVVTANLKLPDPNKYIKFSERK